MSKIRRMLAVCGLIALAAAFSGTQILGQPATKKGRPKLLPDGGKTVSGPKVDDLEGDANVWADLFAHLDRVDHVHLLGIGEFERRSSGIENGYLRAVLAGKRGEFGQAEVVAVEPDGGVIVAGADDDAQLAHVRLRSAVVGHVGPLRSHDRICRRF